MLTCIKYDVILISLVKYLNDVRLKNIIGIN